MDSPAWLVLRGLCRGLHLAGYFSAFGTMFLAAMLLRGKRVQGLRRLAWAGFALALIAGAGWFLLQTAYFATAQSWADIVNAIPTVAEYTRFGALLLGRMAVLLLAALLFQLGWQRPAAVLGLGGVLAESWLGHGAAMGGGTGALLLAVSLAHVAAAAIWLGALPGLYLALKTLPEDGAAPLARGFSPVGMACVAALLVTAFAQYWVLIGAPAAFFASAYGAVALGKILLFGALIVLAALNRARFTPALPASRCALLRSIGAEIALGLVVLMAAGLLLQLEPPAMAGM
ncbi:MAG: CopD family protein [Acidocella sp.]|uniref:CopD family protein n=1 Tax=Acidocella sp. TaxID=50710 RepID=UPI003FC718A9